MKVCQSIFQKAILVLILTIGTSGSVFEFNQRTFMIPHPAKAYRGGEDAFFSSEELLIVADGVGSWIDYSVNPAFYSRFLCSKGAELFS